MTVRKSVALWQPFFFGGGAEAVALWSLEALSDDYDVTLFTLADVDFSRLDAMYATQLSGRQIQVRSALSGAPGQWAYALMAKGKIPRMALVYWTIQQFQAAAPDYDVAFSTYNALDMGCTGIQYLHWIRVVEKAFDQAEPWMQALMKWVNFSHARLASNMSIANSQYTADRVQRCYGIDAEVIYPPVVTEIESVPWIDKENAFLCSGRIVQSKQTHRVIKMLRAVRESGFDIKLHITGGGGNVYGQRYLKQVQELVDQNTNWVFLHQNLPYRDYLKIVAHCRYGIHYKPEPFGISVAEMLKADMLPFVRSKGGQMEIVGADHGALLFANETEGIEKIIAVLSDVPLQENLRQSLQDRKTLFSQESFMSSIQNVVARYLASKETQDLAMTW